MFVRARALRLVAALLPLAAPLCLPIPPLQAQALQPEDGQRAILAAFADHRVVAIGDLHGCEELYDFLFALIREPAFAERTRDIVVEFGNALFQPVVDRYLAGEDVPFEELCKSWRDHTNPIIFDSRVYAAFYQTVREINGKLPPEKRLRVHLGDPPIDWTKTNTNKEWGRLLFQRDPHFAAVVERVAFTAGRPTLLLSGGAHLVRGVSKSNVTALVEAKHPGTMFIVIPHSGFKERNEELERPLLPWRPGTLARLRGTWLGALHPGQRFAQLAGVQRSTADGRQVPARLEDLADAWLYVGPRDLLTEAMPFPGIYRDAYWQELQRRHQLMWGTPLDAASGDINTSARYYVRPKTER